MKVLAGTEDGVDDDAAFTWLQNDARLAVAAVVRLRQKAHVVALARTQADAGVVGRREDLVLDPATGRGRDVGPLRATLYEEKRTTTALLERSAGPWNTASMLLPSGSSKKAAK